VGGSRRPSVRDKDPNAKALGAKDGAARATVMTPERRSEVARSIQKNDRRKFKLRHDRDFIELDGYSTCDLE
jgi:hypothetical protein